MFIKHATAEPRADCDGAPLLYGAYRPDSWVIDIDQVLENGELLLKTAAAI